MSQIDHRITIVTVINNSRLSMSLIIQTPQRDPRSDLDCHCLKSYKSHKLILGSGLSLPLIKQTQQIDPKSELSLSLIYKRHRQILGSGLSLS